MRVFIQTKKFNSGGPASFKNRLIEYFKKINGVEVVTDFNKKFDIELCFIRRIFKHDKPYVIRIDGCYYMKSLSSNILIKNAVEHSKFVIYQSDFSRLMCESILGVSKKNCIIYNGIDQEYIKSIPEDRDIVRGSFVSISSPWRHNKRPYSMINGFLRSRCDRHLYIIGEGISDTINSEYVHFLGKLDQKKIISIMKACDYQIHLCHIDSCPNAVVEGLSCGLNVLCTNLGGTREIVKGNGIVLETDQWDYKVMKYADLDNLDPKLVSDGINKLLNIKERAERPDLDISNSGNQYINILRQVLNGG